MNNKVTPLHKHRIISRLEVKAYDDEQGIFEGYGSKFGNEDSYGDVVVAGAFKNSIEKYGYKGIKLLYQHDSTQPIGYFEILSEDNIGLWFRAKLLVNDIAKAKEVYALLKNGVIDGMSIGYTINPGGSTFSPDGRTRILSDIDLWEISVVTFPANEEALVTNVKTKEPMTIREFENFLRESGFSKSEACALASHGFKGLQRDAEPETKTDNEELSDGILEIMTALKQGVKDHYE